MKEYFVYIMTSRTGTLYVGMTSNLLKRVYQHKEGVYEGFTKKYGVNRLVYFERNNDPREAVARERQLKRWSRSKKLNLIESLYPKWQDLSSEWFE